MRTMVCSLLLILAGTLMLGPSVAQACTLDNVASVSANGERAILSASQPSPGKQWAPFRFAQAYATGTPITLQEARSDLTRSLPAALLTTPFRWRLGDGRTVRGMSVTHQWARSGNYLIQVYAYAASRAQWLLFDSVLVQVVPASQLWQANLGYHLLQGLNLVFSWLGRLVTGALAALLIYSVVAYRRGRKLNDAGDQGT
ncbi:MAG TPA: PKD domain-containing protein [Chloroflexota bacterium]|nr:PKD domain-containing protein [Chloroflexota bacterium]